ncbi:cytochrome P450 [Actinophytocola xanthii]|uniref:cytochrome P450 n=1 Tax=Actinophytocola xanthii TaxID=1912961 RepID=UPI0018E91D66|nr:cytochrome P450 [Actinophytocola xanthii]
MTLEELADDPHPLLARLRESEPVAWVPALQGWLVTRYDLALAVLRDADTFTVDDPRFSTARVIGPSMLSRDGAEHARHRTPFLAPFRPAAVRDHFAPFIAATAADLIAAFPPDEVELRSAFAGPLAVAVVVDALGLPGVDAATVRSWYAAMVDSVSAVTAGADPTPEGATAYRDLHEAVSRGLHFQTHTLTEAEVVANAAVLMFGGIDTTEGMITNLVRHLLLHPAPVTSAAVEESVRLEPAAAVVDRYATRDTALAGVPVPAGDLVVVSLAGANRDPAVFPDPDTFDPHRPNASMNLSFARGPHFCIGARLARVETEIAARTLFETFPNLRLAPDHPHTPHGLVFRKPTALHVRTTMPT